MTERGSSDGLSNSTRMLRCDPKHLHFPLLSQHVAQAATSPRLGHSATTASMKMSSLAVRSSRPMLDHVLTAHKALCCLFANLTVTNRSHVPYKE